MQINSNLTCKRFSELSNRAYSKNYAVFSDFLNIDEQSELLNTKLVSNFFLFGGFETAERKIACFYNDFKPELSDFPLECIKISPANSKFADKLTHRDFLGSVIGLGIKRETLGDIIVNENCGYIFCLDTISGFIVENLKKVKHTTVTCEKIHNLPENVVSKPVPESIIVPSLRIDAVCAGVYKFSRSNAKTLFEQNKIFVNSKICQNSSYILKENDLISVRGFGRFIYSRTVKETKKSRLVIDIENFK